MRLKFKHMTLLLLLIIEKQFETNFCSLLYLPWHLAKSFELAKKIKSNHKHYIIYMTFHASQISESCEINIYKLKAGDPISV